MGMGTSFLMCGLLLSLIDVITYGWVFSTPATVIFTVVFLNVNN